MSSDNSSQQLNQSPSNKPVMTTTTPLLANHEDIAANVEKMEIYFQDNTTKIYFGSTLVHLQISNSHVILFSAKDNSIVEEFSHKDLIGSSFKTLQTKTPKNPKSNTVYQVNLFYYFVQKSWFSCSSEESDKKRYRKEIHLYVYNVADEYCSNLQNYFYRIVNHATPMEYSNYETFQVRPISQKSILVFVNPVSGKRIALKVYKKYVEPMLKEAGIKVELIVTTHAYHAKEYVANPENDLLRYCCILTVGGDGILAEVINGVISRGTNPADGSEQGEGLALLKQIPIVPIPGGTGNGVSKSILFAVKEDSSPLNAVFNVIKGKPFPLDLSRVVTKDGKTHYAFLMLAWGVVSDIDIHSETLRFLGEIRLTIYGVYYALARRIYRGKLRLKLLSSPTSSEPATTIQDPKIVSKINLNKVLPTDTVLDDNWIEIDSEFALLCIIQTSHLARTVYFGPGVRLNDGVFTVYIGHRLSRLQMANILLSMDTGGHIYSRGIRIFQCTEYILEPASPDGIYSLDGEVVEYGRIHGTVMPSAGCVRMIQD